VTSIESLIVVGSSGTGKTTLVDGLRTPTYRSRVVVPRRFVTRLGRLDDDPNETAHLDQADFQRLVDAKTIHPYWHRTLEHGRRERYGFEMIDEADSRLRVFAANNAFLRDHNASVLEVLDTAIVVIVQARRETRNARLSAKNMPADESDVRLDDDGGDLLDADLVDARLVDTTDLTRHEGQQALRSITDELFSTRSWMS